jgi:molybdopterin-guanine dinucleotide biosynthesis protein A
VDVRITGVILAGGRSSRMGGGDKCLLPLAGRPLLAHVIARLTPQVGPLALNANGDPARFAAFGLPVVPDPVGGNLGPLAGILAALTWHRGQGFAGDWVATVAADTPLIPHDLVARLAAARDGNHVILAASRGRVHYPIGLWSTTLAGDLAAWLRSDKSRAVRGWVERHRWRQVDLAGAKGGLDPFVNVNGPADLAALEVAVANEARR